MREPHRGWSIFTHFYGGALKLFAGFEGSLCGKRYCYENFQYNRYNRALEQYLIYVMTKARKLYNYFNVNNIYVHGNSLMIVRLMLQLSYIVACMVMLL